MGVDIGTTSTKAVLFNKRGGQLAEASKGYPLETEITNAAEQNPEEILTAVKYSIHHAMKKSGIEKSELEFISFSSAMHSLMAVDRSGTPLTKVITWADRRSSDYAKKLNETIGHEIYLRTGTPIHAMSPLVKLMWLKNEHQNVFSDTYKFIGIKEYIFYQFFGVYLVDYSVANATGLFNMKKMDWDKEALSIVGITKNQLSKLVPTTEIVDHVNEKIADELGISTNTSFIIGASDGCLANLGVGATSGDAVALSIGTSGAMRIVANEPVSDEKGRLFSYALTENHWVVGGPVNNGGIALQWGIDTFYSEEKKEMGEEKIFQYVMNEIDQTSIGSEQLIFHPYLTGERAPIWNEKAKGSFFGLGLQHKKNHLMRSILEGITMNLGLVKEALSEYIGTPDKILATGGFTKSEVWVQLVANVLNCEVHLPQITESTCFGAVLLGLYAKGDLNDLNEATSFVDEAKVYYPAEHNAEKYRELLSVFETLGEQFRSSYKLWEKH